MDPQFAVHMRSNKANNCMNSNEVRNDTEPFLYLENDVSKQDKRNRRFLGGGGVVPYKYTGFPVMHKHLTKLEIYFFYAINYNIITQPNKHCQ